MNGHVQEVGASFAVIVNGETVALRPDRESAERCLLDVYLFGKSIAQSIPDFHCGVCGKETDIAPDPPAKAVCPEHCEDHDYIYVPGERRHVCAHCGQERQQDWND